MIKKAITLILVTIYALTAWAEPAQLINDASQMWSEVYPQGLKNLIDNDKNSVWATDAALINKEHYLDVIFPDGIEFEADEKLLLMIKRPWGVLNGHPTAFEIKGSDSPEAAASADADMGEGYRYAYLLYRGPETYEYSSRIGLVPGKRYYRLRFTVKANNSKSFTRDGFRYMRLAEFQLYKIKDNEEYPGNLRDRFHLKSDVHFDFADYEFRRTGGITDPKVRELNNSYTGIKLNDWIGSADFDADGKWTADLEFFEKHKDRLTPPDQTPVTRATDPRITTDVRYQPTHVVEHELYAIPGDVVALYPFYDLHGVAAYKEQYSHWYDYSTGGNATNENGERVLDFLVNPMGVAISNSSGWFGGAGMRYPMEVQTFEIGTVDEFKNFVKAVNGGKYNAKGVLTADLDFNGATNLQMIATSNRYCGTFEGNGHTIKNLQVNTGNCGALFAHVGPGAVIRNLIIDESCLFRANERAGVIGEVQNGPTKGTMKIVLQNIINRGTVKGNKYAGGIAGCVSNSIEDNALEVVFDHCAFSGTLTGANEGSAAASSGAIAGSFTGLTKGEFKNCYSDGSVNIKDSGSIQLAACGGADHYSFTDCYSTVPYSGDTPAHSVLQMQPDEANTDGFTTRIGGTWHTAAGFPLPDFGQEAPANECTPLLMSESREFGAVATFFYPRNTEQHMLQNLDREYYICADFCQSFNFELFDHKNKTITEPIINFRHIFHIKDGKQFADENCSTKEKNDAYIRKNRRHITAQAGKDFQIRFHSPVPAQPTTRSRLYYKVTADGSDYRRVCSMRLRVRKNGVIVQDINTEVNDNVNNLFYAGKMFSGYGTRRIDGITYSTCGGNSSYYRMLQCDAANALEGTYVVELIGLDYNGNVIIIPDGSNTELRIQEFEITFLPKTAAVLVPEADLSKPEYRHATNQWLESNYGKPADKIDYDEFMLYEELGDKKNHYLNIRTGKRELNCLVWPVGWKSANYAFDYQSDNDFNMYRVVNHSSRVQYNALATKNMPASKNFGSGVAGLFDRTFYESEGVRQGYYYWVNAASDPGVMGYLRLKEFCPGSSVHVSGWISEFSGGEIANLTLNFTAILNNGERIPLHSHTTGYLANDETLGTWNYFYANFVPILTDKNLNMADIDHFEIELDNNCSNSNGADYAIDDIRVYVIKPAVYADQLAPVCDDTNESVIKISSPFDVLLQSLGYNAADNAAEGENIELYYSFIDHKKYRELLAGGASTDEAFDKAVLRYKYRDGASETHFGKIEFNSHFESNPLYETNTDHALTSAAFREVSEGTYFITFDTRPHDDTMASGKEYLLVLYMRSDGDDAISDKGPGAAEYQLEAIGSNYDCSKSCVFRINASHIIKIDGEVVNDNEIVESCRNQSPVVQVDLRGKTGDNDDIDIVEENAFFDWYTGTLDEFSDISDEKSGATLRDALLHFREVYPEATDLSDAVPQNSIYTKADSTIISRYSSVDPTGATKPLLYLRQNSFVFPPLTLEEDETERYAYVLAVPIAVTKDHMLICGQPAEVRITVRQRAPRMRHGIDDPGITYPAAIDDVPLRISLDQLKKTTAASKDYYLEVPVYSVAPVTDGVTSLTRLGGGSPIFLVATDGDPDYKNLDFESPVGEITRIDASTTGSENRFRAIFYGDRMNFKEGYTYRFRFSFEEQAPAGSDQQDICIGHDVFTLKVVPEYQKWTASHNMNWNNDRNWRRVSSSEFRGSASELTTDGPNGRSSSFAPLNFTKAIIPAGKTFPHLFGESTSTVAGHAWAYDPSEDSEAGEATSLVQYDMAEHTVRGEAAVFCRPWYAHTCSQIHFEPESQIYGQHHLHYDKAWIDMEVTPSIWLTASSPLSGTVAGDMYLPTANGRQETEYFRDITFSTATNNRFMPAVFQRSWDKAQATVYTYPGNGNTVDARVETTWSKVYNDVRVPYSGAEGFSIRTDISKLATQPDKVLFRLPKADTFYEYYTDGGATGDKTGIGRTRPGKLVFDESSAERMVASLQAASEQNRYFLVGNPFVAHLDMARFFEENSGEIEAKYWIMTGAQQGAAVMSPDGTITGSTSGEAGYVQPLVSFFVEARKPGTTLSLTFTPDMIAIPEAKPSGSRSTARAGLRISELTGGSSALVLAEAGSAAGYDPTEDAIFINDNSLGTHPRIYTSCGTHAMTVNVCPDIDGTEVGITADENAVSVLRFEGVDASEGLMLYDSDADSYTAIAEGSEISVRGGARNRLFLVSDRMKALDNSIAINQAGDRVTVTSVAGGLEVRIYNTSGIQVAANDDRADSATFTLGKGIFIVEAADAETTLTRKILVR